jgi:predicted esterase
MTNTLARHRFLSFRLATLAGLLLATASVPCVAQQASSPDAACAELAKLSVPAASIQLPTGGAKVISAVQVAAATQPPRTVGSFCRVMAEIASANAGQPIKMELNLPDDWNGKALMYGGGGYNGSILSTGGTIRLQPADVTIPLGRGYATFASNSGHEGSSADGSFAVDDEALRNYALDAVKKTRDAAVYLTRARYGRAPDKLYFHGSSNGGKEALGMIQRYPADLDGAMIFWPATHLGTASLQFGRIARALAQPGAALSMAKRKALLSAAVQACDGADGVKDGIISDVRACQEKFDPATSVVDGKPLRCASGADEGDGCLSDQQITALKVMATPIKLGFATESGETSYPGLYVWSTDLGTKSSDDLSKLVTSQGLGTVSTALPAAAGMPFIHIFSDQYIRFFVTRNKDARWTDIDPEKPGEWQARLAYLAGLLDMPKTDLSEFNARGGKIIIVHGLSDQIVPPKATEEYYERVVAKMGAETVKKFLKFYEVPGTAHSGVGTAFTPTWDVLGALDAWATGGKAPVDPIVTDTYAVPGRTRPLCEYPAWPKYKGEGDINSATSFVCAN